MINEIRKISVFVVRDFRVIFTYRLAFAMSFISILFNFFYMVLFGSMFKSGVIPALSAYGGDFVAYILVGSVGWGFLWAILGGTSQSMRQEMELGTLESIFLTPTSIYTMIVAYTICGAIFGLLSIVVLVVFGYFLFGISVFANATLFTLLIFILSAIMMTGFGMILGGLTIWIKYIGDTVSLLQSIAMFFCGVYFPIYVLPGVLQSIAKFIPFYYSIEGLRLSLIPNTPTSEIIEHVIILTLCCILSVSTGIYTLHKGLKKAKKDGSLSFY